MQWTTAVPDRSSTAEWASSVAWFLAPESLVLVDVANDDAERIGEQHCIRYFIAEAVDDICRPAFPALFLLVAQRIKDLLKLDVCAVRGLPPVVKYDGLNLDVHVRGAGIEKEGLKS